MVGNPPLAHKLKPNSVHAHRPALHCLASNHTRKPLANLAHTLQLLRSTAVHMHNGVHMLQLFLHSTTPLNGRHFGHLLLLHTHARESLKPAALDRTPPPTHSSTNFFDRVARHTALIPPPPRSLLRIWPRWATWHMTGRGPCHSCGTAR